MRATANTASKRDVWFHAIGPTSAGWLIAAVVCAILAAAPAYPGIGIAASTDMPMAFLALTLGALSAASLTSLRPAALPGRAVWAVLASFLAMIVVSGLSSSFAAVSVFGSPQVRFGLMTAVPLMLILIVGRSLSAEIGWLLRAASPWVFGAWVVAMVWQSATREFLPWGLSSNNAMTAQIMILLLPAFLTVARRRKAMRFAMGSGVAMVLWWASSSMGVAIAAGWTVVDAVLSRGRIRRIPRAVLIAAPIAQLVLSLGVIVAALSRGADPTAWGSRVGIWRLALATFPSSPFFGTGGMDALRTATASHVSSATVQVVFDTPIISISAHSLWLDLAVGYGIIGGLIALAGMLVLARGWSESVSAPGFVYVAGLLLFSLTLMVQPLSLQTMPVLILTIVASLQPRAGDGSARRVVRGVAVGGIASSLVLFAFACTNLAVGRPDFHPGSSATVAAAARVWRFDPELWSQAGYRYGAELGSAPDQRAAAARMDEAFVKAVLNSPRDYTYLLESARTGGELGMDDALVRRRYQAALDAYPLSPDGNYHWGLYLAAQGDRVGASAAYAVLRTLYPTWSGTQEFKTIAASMGIPLE